MGDGLSQKELMFMLAADLITDDEYLEFTVAKSVKAPIPPRVPDHTRRLDNPGSRIRTTTTPSSRAAPSSAHRHATMAGLWGSTTATYVRDEASDMVWELALESYDLAISEKATEKNNLEVLDHWWCVTLPALIAERAPTPELTLDDLRQGSNRARVSCELS